MWSSCSGAGDGVAAAGSLQSRPAVWTMSLDRRAPLDDLMAAAALEQGELQPFAGADGTGSGIRW